MTKLNLKEVDAAMACQFASAYSYSDYDGNT